VTSVFEAVVNAVAHRDYSIYGSKIRLRLYDDRLVLYSPGSPPNTMDVASMMYRQAARNEIVTNLLARWPVPEEAWLRTDRRTLMDRRGEGVPIILERSEALAGVRPVYGVIDDAELELTIFAAWHARGAPVAGDTEPVGRVCPPEGRGPREGPARSSKGEDDGREIARLPGEGRHPAQWPEDPLLRVAGTEAQPGAAASVLRIRPHVGMDGELPWAGMPRVRPRPAGPRR
jgi:hypothetical protein